jgi:hypothetical protein
LWRVIRKSISEPDQIYNLKKKLANNHEIKNDEANRGKSTANGEESKSLCDGGDISFNPNINNCSSIKSIITQLFINI